MITSRSLRIPDATIARYPSATRPPDPHTAAELARLLQLLRAANADTIAVGHGRHPASVRAGDAIAAAWTRDAGTVQSVVSWPADAASWLRPACRLTAANPDAVVVADTAAGFSQLARRLASQAGWSANRTLGFASLANADLIALTGTTLTGMTGATTTGNSWLIGHGLLILGDQP